ncbi:hypothetical protein K0U00_32460, partial [Paenibacillus sepulcri]|nr:hypothetical protein [Paenibacillus sepulcri]
MTMLKTMAKISGAALLLFGMNGLINYTLLKPLDGGAKVFNQFRHHLDDAIFVLLFVFVAFIFWAMFAVLNQERGYLYLGLISFLTSLQLFAEWDDKLLLFGPFPEIPYNSLAIKSGVAFLSFAFVSYLLGTSNRPVVRLLL